MFDKRIDLVRLLAVADAGTILAASNRLAITQPALSRDIARIEGQFEGQLFERLPTGMRLTPFGATVADRARHLLREIEAAEETVHAAVSGRTGRLRVTAGPVWMHAVLPAAVARFHRSYPGVELELRTATRGEGIVLLANAQSDLHCGGIDTGEALAPFLAREPLAPLPWGIVAHRDHPLHARHVTSEDLADHPWIDYDAPATTMADRDRPSLARVLDTVYHSTGRCARTIVRAGSSGLFLMATGPYLSWLSLAFLERLSGLHLTPLGVDLGRDRFQTGFVSRRSAATLAPFRRFKAIVRDVALG